MPFVGVCAATDLPEGGMRRFDVAGRAVAVYRVAGAFHATAAVCTHEHAFLTDGELEGLRVRCPLHGSRFDITTGRVLGPPAYKRLPVFAAREREGQIEVELP